MRKSLGVFAVVALLAAVEVASAAPIVVDHFTEVDAGVTTTPAVLPPFWSLLNAAPTLHRLDTLAPNTVQTVSIHEGGLGSVLGGTRQSSLSTVGVGLFAQSTSISPNTQVGGIFFFNADNGVESEAGLRYDGGGTGLGSFAGVASVNLEFRSADAGMPPGQGLPLEVRLTDQDGTQIFSNALLFDTVVQTVVAFPLAGFGLDGSFPGAIAGFDLTNVLALEVFFNRPFGTNPRNSAFDIDLHAITLSQIPEPSSVLAWVAMGMTAVLVGFRRRRRTA